MIKMKDNVKEYFDELLNLSFADEVKLIITISDVGSIEWDNFIQLVKEMDFNYIENGESRPLPQNSFEEDSLKLLTIKSAEIQFECFFYDLTEIELICVFLNKNKEQSLDSIITLMAQLGDSLKTEISITIDNSDCMKAIKYLPITKEYFILDKIF